MCNVLQCQMWDVVPYSSHPNVAVMWNKVRCRICVTRCDVVQCQV